MSFKLQQLQAPGEDEGIPVATNLNQPLIRPTTTMGGRKKYVKSSANEPQIKEDEIDGLSEVSGEHSTGGGAPNNMESNPRSQFAHKKIKLKKLTS